MKIETKPDEVDETDVEEPTEEEMTDALEALGSEPVPWHGVLAPMGKMTGDRRMFKEGSIEHRTLPLPFQWVKSASAGHDGAVVVANIQNIEYEGGLIKGSGLFHVSPEADEVISLRAAGMLRGVSVDLDAMEVEFVNEDGSTYDFEAETPIGDAGPVMLVTKARIASVTAVAIPAFEEAYFDLGTWEEAMASNAECQECDDEDVEVDEDEEVSVVAAAFAVRDGDYCVFEGCREEASEAIALSDKVEGMYCSDHASTMKDALAAGEIQTFAPGTKDGPGWITHPKATARIREYWVRGEGALKIRWGQPGDFNRCRKQLAKYVKNPDWLAGLCANMHKEALGIWPGQHHSVEDLETFMSKQVQAPAFTLVDAHSDSLTASGAVTPAAWFENPNFSGITPLTIMDDGRIFGHMATWRECHTGVQDRCVTAPHHDRHGARRPQPVAGSDTGSLRQHDQDGGRHRCR